MKNKLLIFGLIFLSFGLGNFLLIFVYYSWCCDNNLVLLVPFGGNWSGNVPDPIWQFLLSNEILENIGQRLGSGGTYYGFNNGWPFSIWEMSWSISLYLSMILLPVWFYKYKKCSSSIHRGERTKSCTWSHACHWFRRHNIFYWNTSGSYQGSWKSNFAGEGIK